MSEDPLPKRYDSVDWDSDDAGVLEGAISYTLSEEDTYVGLRHEMSAPSLCVLASLDHEGNLEDSGYVALSVEDETEDANSFSLEVTADEADRLAEQLQLAAEFARDGEGADVRT